MHSSFQDVVHELQVDGVTEFTLLTGPPTLIAHAEVNDSTPIMLFAEDPESRYIHVHAKAIFYTNATANMQTFPTPIYIFSLSPKRLVLAKILVTIKKRIVIQVYGYIIFYYSVLNFQSYPYDIIKT